MLLASSRLTPALNAHVYAIRRSPSTIGPVVVLLTTPPASTWLRRPTRNARHAGLITASPAVEPATGFRHAVAFASPGLTGNVPVIARRRHLRRVVRQRRRDDRALRERGEDGERLVLVDLADAAADQRLAVAEQS